MGKIKVFFIWGGLAAAGAFALYIVIGGLVGLIWGWPFTQFALPGAVGCAIGAGLANGAICARQA